MLFFLLHNKDTSLEGKRLKVDTIDPYYQHRIDPNVPIEEVSGALE
jgi:aryl-alcohol dehydrogenase-like predicted oxidoreductase